MKTPNLFPYSKKEEINLSLSIQFVLIALLSAKQLSYPSKNAIEKLIFYTEILQGVVQICDDELASLLVLLQTQVFAKKGNLDEYGQNLYKFFKSFTHILQTLPLDENVLTFLLEKREEINNHFGKNEIENFLRPLFPEGASSLKSKLFGSYSKRGFELFYKKVEPLIDQISWENPCKLNQMP